MDLHEETITQVATFLTVAEVGCAASVCHALESVCASELLWEQLCERHWATKEKQYHLTPQRRAEFAADDVHWASLSPGAEPLRSVWRSRYAAAERDGKRTHFASARELSDLTFDFRFRSFPQESMSTKFRFDLGEEQRLSGHPHGMTHRWTLQDGGKVVTIESKGSIEVKRLPSWGWALRNQMVVFVSHNYEEGSPIPGAELPAAHRDLFQESDRLQGMQVAALQAMFGSRSVALRTSVLAPGR